VARDDWLSAADTLAVLLHRLKEQSACSDRFIPLSPTLGLTPTLGLMTYQILSIWASNLVFVMEKNVGELQFAEVSSG
jgi:hypothetical protein